VNGGKREKEGRREHGAARIGCIDTITLNFEHRTLNQSKGRWKKKGTMLKVQGARLIQSLGWLKDGRSLSFF